MNRQEASLEMKHEEKQSGMTGMTDMRENNQKVSEISEQEISRSLEGWLIERRPIDQRQCETSTPCAPRRRFSPLQQMPNLSFKLPSHASTTAI